MDADARCCIDTSMVIIEPNDSAKDSCSTSTNRAAM
jgi:hypothetical protein